MTSEFHPPVEEYLQSIQCLSEGGQPVIQARLAQRMGKSAPAVSEMLDRLSAEGYVERSGRKITLTEKGRSIAESVLRKHRL
ncbi:MAG TPA: metal-dependent transcriptional regulator, partial [Acidimicrobiales bacterium]|nr:metal-dependent transcriptional regulator [Acidimicrobiales bacterium]